MSGTVIPSRAGAGKWAGYATALAEEMRQGSQRAAIGFGMSFPARRAVPRARGAIRIDLAEACDYLRDPLLRSRTTITGAVAQAVGEVAPCTEELMGGN